MPVSYPDWLVTNGNRRSQLQALMLNMVTGVCVWQKRGIAAVEAGAAVGTVESGAKLTATVAPVVVMPGKFVAVFETKAGVAGRNANSSVVDWRAALHKWQLQLRRRASTVRR